MTAGREPVDTVSEIGHAEAAAQAAWLRPVLPPEFRSVFDIAFIRSHLLYDEFVHRLAVQVVRESGVERVVREPATVEEITDRAKLDPAAAALVPLDWMLRFLAARGVLQHIAGERGDRYGLRGPLRALDPAAVRDEQLRHDPSWKPAYVLAETVARDYPAFLRGEVSGEEVLFAPRRLRLWIDYFSNDNGLYAVNNAVGAAAVEQWLPRLPATLLEVGGGLGSGALALLDRLGGMGRLGAIAEYRFTEFVPAFLRRGEQTIRARHPALSAVTFAPLDMNRSFPEQGVAPGSVSVVFAVNTLHVARDLGFTLGEVRRALEPGGRLVVSECVRPRPRHPIYPDFVFNLMETFRSPRLHPRYRPGGGFLTPEQWQAAMEAAGFVDVRVLPDVATIRRRVPDFLVAAIGATSPG
jgi:SAM-dependent methyltransferase